MPPTPSALAYSDMMVNVSLKMAEMENQKLSDEEHSSAENGVVDSSPKKSKKETVTNSSNEDEAGPMFTDDNLPSGWRRHLVQRKDGESAGKWDVYIYNPEGKKFRSRNQLGAWLDMKGIKNLEATDFDFSVKGKHNTRVLTPKVSKKTPGRKPVTPKAVKSAKKKSVTPVANKAKSSTLFVKMAFGGNTGKRQRSSSRHQENGNGELEESPKKKAKTSSEGASPNVVGKSPRGRKPGSKNKTPVSKTKAQNKTPPVTPVSGKKRGRPKKNPDPISEPEPIEEKSEEVETVVTEKKRGRPKKNPDPSSPPPLEEDITPEVKSPQPEKKRGRPKKTPAPSSLPEEDKPQSESTILEKKRGRPRKSKETTSPPIEEIEEEKVKTPAKSPRKTAKAAAQQKTPKSPKAASKNPPKANADDICSQPRSFAVETTIEAEIALIKETSEEMEVPKPGRGRRKSSASSPARANSTLSRKADNEITVESQELLVPTSSLKEPSSRKSTSPYKKANRNAFGEKTKTVEKTLPSPAKKRTLDDQITPVKNQSKNPKSTKRSVSESGSHVPEITIEAIPEKSPSKKRKFSDNTTKVIIEAHRIPEQLPQQIMAQEDEISFDDGSMSLASPEANLSTGITELGEPLFESSAPPTQVVVIASPCQRSLSDSSLEDHTYCGRPPPDSPVRKAPKSPKAASPGATSPTRKVIMKKE